MTENSFARNATRTAWSACPSRLSDLTIEPRVKPPLDKCKFCGAALAVIWWQRYLFAAISVLLSLAVPAALGIRGIVALLFVALVCIFPVAVLSYILVFKIIPPKYVKRTFFPPQNPRGRSCIQEMESIVFTDLHDTP